MSIVPNLLFTRYPLTWTTGVNGPDVNAFPWIVSRMVPWAGVMGSAVSLCSAMAGTYRVLRS
jgi:hypothetical protein